MARYIPPKALPAAEKSARLLVVLPPRQVGLFRFLLEGYDNLALFTVIEPRAAMLKLMFSPHMLEQTRAALDSMKDCLDLRVEPYPFPEPGNVPEN